jgi:hypothetical protein
MPAVAATIAACPQCAAGLAGFSAAATGPAATATTSDSGTRIRTDQVSSAEAICLTRAFSAGSVADRSADRASTGTITLASAPPSTSSYTRLGTWFAVTYAVPRHVAPTVWENTSVRTSPSTRDSIVSPAITAAPRAMPGASRGRLAVPAPVARASSVTRHHPRPSAPAFPACDALPGM